MKDPTGAGDSFAGGLMGALASLERESDAASEMPSPAEIARAMVYATVTASYAVSEFSVDGLAKATRADVEARAEDLRRFVAP